MSQPESAKGIAYIAAYTGAGCLLSIGAFGCLTSAASIIIYDRYFSKNKPARIYDAKLNDDDVPDLVVESENGKRQYFIKEKDKYVSLDELTEKMEENLKKQIDAYKKKAEQMKEK